MFYCPVENEHTVSRHVGHIHNQVKDYGSKSVITYLGSCLGGKKTLNMGLPCIMEHGCCLVAVFPFHNNDRICPPDLFRTG